MKIVMAERATREAHGWKTIHEFYGEEFWSYDLYEDLEEDGRKLLLSILTTRILMVWAK
jgi:hypothetical protein